MIEMMVFDAGAGNRGLGERKFCAMPRVGDHVAIKDDRGPAAYQVVGVLYTENSESPGIDLFVAGRMPASELFIHMRTLHLREPQS